MFTGIIEEVAKVTKLEKEQENLHITVECSFTNELKVDQSVAHNGVCLTIVDIKDNEYTVTAILETLEKSSLGKLKVGTEVNLERGMTLGERLDGHIVQGHVDQTAVCTEKREADGSFYFAFEYDKTQGNPTIEKGSVTINGTSLTVVNSGVNTFEVAIIPFTMDHTNFGTMKPGDTVNLEFDVIGKYVAKLMAQRG
ncbi:MAG: riboflavin synthase [Ichthyobacteriaceae bacterium]|nr:riboflavin synthase [Ichthyobacteriaceae bacterium]